MNGGERERTVAETLAEFTRLCALDFAWLASSAGERLELVRRGAPEIRAGILESGRASCVRTCDLALLPYPTSFAFGGAATSPLPFIAMTNRMLVVELVTRDGGLRRLLFNPTDVERSAETPFFARIQARFGARVAARVKRLTRRPTPLEHLAALGLSPADVDYVAFDHLHTQDLRRILGTSGEAGWFPRAKLLVHAAELDILRRLHPLQEAWFVRDAILGVARDRIAVLGHGDWLLGRGVALVRTPGHTVGNMSLVVNTTSGAWVVSENGVACDNYAPRASKIPGLARHARTWDVDVVLNSNTLEGRNEQYTSMILERELADRSAKNPDFYQHFSSSELTRTPLTPGLAPTFAHGKIESGDFTR
ncbi:MAG TPA: hypothetical protein VGM56_18595 [Byssovorax sp.]